MHTTTNDTPASRLGRYLDRTGVDHLWLPGTRIDWMSGMKAPALASGREAHTHCSAFVAAISMRLGIYVLRPPEHGEELLADAQSDWLRMARGDGWRRLGGEGDAVEAANTGALVLVSYHNPDTKVPGHIGIVRPGAITDAELAAGGPWITQAGGTNYLRCPLAVGFTWRRFQVAYYAHALGDVPN